MIQLAQACILASVLIQAGGSSTGAPPSSTRLGDIRDDLLDLAKRDQKARKALVQAYQPDGNGGFSVDGEIMRAVNDIDTQSTAYLKAMVEEVGWPTIEMVGTEAAHAAWLLAQHADKNPEFQSRVLALMKPLVAEKQVNPVDFAMLTDRVRLAEGKPQIYGTQFSNDESGVMRPSATEDWDHVDQRRAEIGMPPIADYAESLAELYGGRAELDPLPLGKPSD